MEMSREALITDDYIPLHGLKDEVTVTSCRGDKIVQCGAKGIRDRILRIGNMFNEKEFKQRWVYSKEYHFK